MKILISYIGFNQLNMKKWIAIIICLFLVTLHAEAQRRIPGQRGIQASVGVSDGYGLLKNKKISYQVGISLSHYTLNKNKWLYGVEYWEKQYCYGNRSIPVSQLTAEYGYYYTFWSNRGKDIFLSGGLSGLAGYEVLNWGKKKLPDGATLTDKNGLIGGTALTFEIETYVCDRIILLIHIRERILFGSSINKFHHLTGLGIKYIL